VPPQNPPRNFAHSPSLTFSLARSCRFRFGGVREPHLNPPRVFSGGNCRLNVESVGRAGFGWAAHVDGPHQRKRGETEPAPCISILSLPLACDFCHPVRSRVLNCCMRRPGARRKVRTARAPAGQSSPARNVERLHVWRHTAASCSATDPLAALPARPNLTLPGILPADRSLSR